MHITMGIGAMLLGGWVLSTPVDQDNLKPAQPAPQPAVAAPQPGAGQSANQYNSRAMDEQGYKRMLEEERGMRHRRRDNQSPSRMQRQAPGTRMPTSPTQPAQGAAGLPLSPTADPTTRCGSASASPAPTPPRTRAHTASPPAASSSWETGARRTTCRPSATSWSSS